MKENYYTNTQGEEKEKTIEKVLREIKEKYGERIVVTSHAIFVQARNKKNVWALEIIEKKYGSDFYITRDYFRNGLLIKEE